MPRLLAPATLISGWGNDFAPSRLMTGVRRVCVDSREKKNKGKWEGEGEGEHVGGTWEAGYVQVPDRLPCYTYIHIYHAMRNSPTKVPTYLPTYTHVPHVPTTRPPGNPTRTHHHPPTSQISNSRHRSGKTESLHRVNVPSVQITSHGRGYRNRWVSSARPTHFDCFTPCAPT